MILHYNKAFDVANKQSKNLGLTSWFIHHIQNYLILHFMIMILVTV